jgi:histidyl-tRNA synthetase
MQTLIADAPLITDHLDDESAAHFATLRERLDRAGVPYRLNPRLVRGLDYYSRTVFEWITTDLGLAGRGLLGRPLRRARGAAWWRGDACGWLGARTGAARRADTAAGRRRRRRRAARVSQLAGAAAESAGLVLAEQWRNTVPGLRVETNCGGGGIKTQMKRADRSARASALLVGDDELARGTVAIKDLRGGHPQRSRLRRSRASCVMSSARTERGLIRSPQRRRTDGVMAWKS